MKKAQIKKIMTQIESNDAEHFSHPPPVLIFNVKLIFKCQNNCQQNTHLLLMQTKTIQIKA